MFSESTLDIAMMSLGQFLQRPVATTQPELPPQVRRLIKGLSSADETVLLGALKAAEEQHPYYLVIGLVANAHRCKIPSLRPQLIVRLGKFGMEHPEYRVAVIQTLLNLSEDPSPEVQEAVDQGLAEIDLYRKKSAQNSHSRQASETKRTEPSSATSPERAGREEIAASARRANTRRPAAASRRRTGQSSKTSRSTTKPPAGKTRGSTNGKRR